MIYICKLHWNCIKDYTKHASWPPPGSKERRFNKVLEFFAFFVEQWLRVERETHEKGGVPNKTLFKTALKAVQAVIEVKDPREGRDPVDAWKMPYFMTLKAALQDVRVLKVVEKIDGIVHNLNVYREEGCIYFDAYDPGSSKMYMSSLSIEDTPGLLIPNATDR